MFNDCEEVYSKFTNTLLAIPYTPLILIHWRYKSISKLIALRDLCTSLNIYSPYRKMFHIKFVDLISYLCVKAKAKSPRRLTKYHTMKTYPVLH